MSRNTPLTMQIMNLCEKIECRTFNVLFKIKITNNPALSELRPILQFPQLHKTFD